MGSTPELLVHSINRFSSATTGIRSCNLATISMRGNHLAYPATQGIFKIVQVTQLDDQIVILQLLDSTAKDTSTAGDGTTAT